MSELVPSVLPSPSEFRTALRMATACAAFLVLVQPAAVAHAQNARVTETPRNRDAETIRDTRIECARMGESAQAVAKQWKDATDAQFGEGLPRMRRVRCAENEGATDHPSGAGPDINPIREASARRWNQRGLKRQSNQQRPRVSVEEVESVEQDLRWARRALERGEPDRAFRIISRVVDRATRVPEDEAAQAFDLLARIGDAHMAAGEADPAATAYAALAELGDHLDDDAATAAATRLRSTTD